MGTVNSIRYYSLTDTTGYGTAAMDYMAALKASGIEIIWSPIVYTANGMVPWEFLEKSRRPKIHHRTKIQAEIFRNVGARADYEAVFIHIMPELFPKLVEPDKLNIGYTVWETDKLPDHWPPLIRSVDRLLVPCQFNQELFSLAGGPQVAVLPHFAQFAIQDFGPHDRSQFRDKYNISPGTHVFYLIATWTPRKAIFETLHAYLLAFDQFDDVCLVMKTDSTGIDYTLPRHGPARSTREMVQDIRENYPDPARIVVLDSEISEHQMLEIHAGCDCYFSLTHGEGWGMGAYDAASLGRPVIITGWGGQCDYLPTDYAYRVDYTLESVQFHGYWASYSANQNWARANIDQAIALLRHNFNCPAEGRDKGRSLAQHIQANFSRTSLTQILLKQIQTDDS